MSATATNIASETGRYSAPHPAGSLAAKRLFDVVAAVFGLLLLSPLFAFMALLLRRESRGPVFYPGERMGMRGRTFRILKFRTMYESESVHDGPRITAADDGRITPLGRWLRATKINELPQLWNVLVGDMSLVGPRPEDPEIAKTWPESVFREVLSVRPGITSPASVIYRDEEKLLKSATLMDDYLKNLLPAKLRLDQLYVRNRSFVSYLDVIFSTLLLLLPGVRRVQVPAESLFNGLLTRFTRRYFSWFVADIVTAFVAVALAGLLQRMSGPLDLGFEQALALAALLAIAFSVVNTLLGLGRVAWRQAPSSYAIALALSSALSTLLIMAANRWLLRRGPLVPMGMLPVAGLLAWLGFMATRYRERLLTGLAAQWLLLARSRQPRLGERVLIVGAGECSMLATWLLRHSAPNSAFSIIGMVDDDPGKQGMTVEGCPVHGLTRRIPELVKAHDVGLILFAIENISPEERRRLLSLCMDTPARLVVVPDFMAAFRGLLRQQPGRVA